MKGFLEDFTAFLILLFIIWGIVALAGEVIDDEFNSQCTKCHYNGD